MQHVIADAKKPLQTGIAQAQEQRRRQGQDSLDSTLDAFHTKHEAGQALTIDWNAVERDWEAFDKAENQLRRARRAGIHAGPAAGKASRAWVKVVKSFARYEAIEAAWKHAALALAVFRPDGQLNDRAWAEAQIAPALPALAGRAWVRVVNHLRTPASFTFLDRMHAALARIPIPQELREALVHLWWLRRQRPGKFVAGPVAGAGHVAHFGAAGDVPEARSQLARVVSPSGGAARYSACQQRGGVHEQRAADAPVAASYINPRHARLEEVVLEHSGVSRWEAKRQVPLRALGAEASQL
ncbi:MAG: hypothetical protein WA746_30990 [Isosphaeraceae bacterium]